MTDTPFPEWADFPMANVRHTDEAEALNRYIGSLIAVWNLPEPATLGPRSVPTDLFDTTPTAVGILTGVRPYHAYVELRLRLGSGQASTYYSDLAAWRIVHYGGQR